MKEVKTPEGFKNTLEKSLKQFMEQNQSFNVQGQWEKNGLTVSVLVDFGIEDRDEGTRYVGNISATYEDNYNLLDEEEARKLHELDLTPEKETELMEKLRERISEHDAFIEAQNCLYRAVNSVFNVPYGSMRSSPVCSDIDVSITKGISYGTWETRKGVDAPMPTHREIEI